MTAVLAVTEDGEAGFARAAAERLDARVGCELVEASELLARPDARVAAHRLVFLRSRAPAVLERLARAEAGGVRVVNAPGAVARSRRRRVALELARRAGAPVPEDFEGPLDALPFGDAVLKHPEDDGRSPSTRWSGERGARLVYAQEALPGAWEHKLYLVGARVFAFVQRPSLARTGVPPASRRRVAPDRELARVARLAAEAVGLELAGVDLIEDERGVARVVDVNANQGLHTFEEGIEALVEHLLARLPGA